MAQMRKISEQQVSDYCSEHNLKHFLVSAKTGKGINELFTSLCEDVINVKEENGEVRIGGKKKKAIRIDENKGGSQKEKA